MAWPKQFDEHKDPLALLGLPREVDVDEALACDEERLLEHLANQPSNYAYFGSRHAMLGTQVAQLERRLKAVMAEAGQRAREAGDKKPTEKAIEEAVRSDAGVQEAQEELEALQQRHALFGVVVEALRQRRYVLIELSSLRRAEIPQANAPRPVADYAAKPLASAGKPSRKPAAG